MERDYNDSRLYRGPVDFHHGSLARDDTADARILVNYDAGPRRGTREPRQQRHRLDRTTCDRVRDAYRGTAIPPWERIALTWRRMMRNLPASREAKFAIDSSFPDYGAESGDPV